MSKKLSKDQKRKKKLAKREQTQKWCNRCGGYWPLNHNCRRNADYSEPPKWLQDEFKKHGMSI